MKNIFKLLAIAFVAGGMMVACGNNNGDDPDPEPEPEPVAAWAANFDGASIDIQALAGASCGYQSSQDGTQYYIWNFQAANKVEGTTVYFPYLVNYMQGESASEFAVADLELFKDTYYELSGYPYGDWQYYSTNSVNCSKMDLTKHMLSYTLNATMWSLTDMVNGVESQDDCTQKPLALTVSNVTFEASK